MAGVFELPNETVEIRYIKKQKGNVVNEKHILYGGLHEDAKIKYVPKQLENGQMANTLTNEEKEYLEKALDLPENGLSKYKKDSYWNTISISLGKQGAVLDLSNPVDYIKYKVLLKYEDQICPNIAEVNKKQTYRFVIVKKDDEAKAVLKRTDVKKEAYKLLGKLEDDRNALRDFLMVSNIRVSEDTSLDWMSAEVAKIVDSNPNKFVDILKDPSYTTRVLFQKAFAKGEIVRKNSQYYTKDGIALAEANQPATLDNAIAYLESNVNQEYRLLLISKV